MELPDLLIKSEIQIKLNRIFITVLNKSGKLIAGFPTLLMGIVGNEQFLTRVNEILIFPNNILVCIVYYIHATI